MADLTVDSGATAFVLLSAALVVVMIPGLALFYGGFVSERMVLTTMMMSFSALAVVSTEWVILTYSLAFAPGASASSDPFLGGTRWALFDAPNALRVGTRLPEHAFFTFQLAFAAVTAAVVSGSVVGRLTHAGWCVFVALWHPLVYTPLARWVWHPTGWLAARGIEDFAGGLVVEVNSGVSAFVLAILVGADARARAATAATAAAAAAGASVPLMQGSVGGGGAWAGGAGASRDTRAPHNAPFILLGAGLLYFGWLGFNAGSALSAGYLAARAFTNTALAGAAGMAAAALCEIAAARPRTGVWGRPTAVGAAVGTVVGLCAITPAAGAVSPMSALTIGAAGAAFSFIAERLLHRVAPHIDDTLACFAGHGVGGAVGIIATGLASSAQEGAPADGALRGGASGRALLATQLAGLTTAIALSAVGTAIAWACARAMLGAVGVAFALDNTQLDDADCAVHGEEAYAARGGAADDESLAGSDAREAPHGRVADEDFIAAVTAIVRKELAHSRMRINA